MSILIVEDDPILSDELYESIRDIFSEYFDPIYQAYTYEEAWSIVNKKTPDILIIDIKLGEDSESGIKLATKIQGKIPFIFVSGLPESVGFQKAKHTLPVAFLNKPCNPSQLTQALSLAEAYGKNKSKAFHPLSFDRNDISVFVTTGRNEYQKIILKELIMIKVDDHYLEAFLINRNHSIMFKGVLKEFYTRYLCEDLSYFKLGRSLIINVGYIKEIKNNKLFLKEIDQGFPIPKNCKADLMKLLDIPYKNT